eukprot:m.210132 g.210132  ORF g.210132 m.210132 type:complete len:397 (-) comp25488_c0_seq1:3504-4694(-)
MTAVAYSFGKGARFDWDERSACYPGTDTWFDNKQLERVSPEAPKLSEGGPRELRSWKEIEREYMKMKRLQHEYAEVGAKIKTFARARERDRAEFEMKEASHQTTIAALRDELGQKEDENARAVAQNIALQTTVQERHAYITLMTATFKEDVERLRESENAATCDHSSLEHRLQQAAKEVKELRAEQAKSTRMMKRQSDTVYALREGVRQRESALERLGIKANEAQDDLGLKFRKENLVADQLARKAADCEVVIAQLEGHLEEARQTAEELKYALDQSVAAEEVGQDCQRRQHDEITVLTEYNEKLKVARMSADTARDEALNSSAAVNAQMNSANMRLDEAMECNQDQSRVIDLLRGEVRHEQDKQVEIIDENAALREEIDRLRSVIRRAAPTTAVE